MKNGMATPSPASSCASPTVTTIRIRRGALENRRMMTNSTTEPSTTDGDQRDRERDPERPAARARSATTQRLAGTAPRSACAKLMTRFDW